MTCALCGAELVDEDGEPRWDLFTLRLRDLEPKLVYVCYDGCRRPQRSNPQ